MKLPTIIAILLVNCNLYIDKCNATHSSMCMGLPVEASGASDPPHTLGIENLFPLDVWKYFKTPVENFKTAAEIAPHRPTVSLYGLKVRRPGGSRYLNGWLKISVDLKESLGFVLCGHDGNKMPVGRFSAHPFPAACGPTLPKMAYNILPCGGVPAYEPYVPNCVVYISESLGNWNRSSPLYNDPLIIYPKLTFYWYFSQQICNLKEMIHFKGYFIQKRPDIANYHPFFQDVYVKSDAEGIFGAADPPPKPGDVEDCNTRVSENNPPWVSRVEGDSNTWTWVYGIPFNNFEEKTGCQSNYFGGRCVNVIDSRRGSLSEMEVPKIDNVPKCQTSIVPSISMMNYIDYIHQMYQNCTCATITTTTSSPTTTAPSSTASPGAPDQPEVTPPKDVPNDSSALSCESDLGRIIWALRKSHAVCMIIVTMFLSPVSIFISRYFKESFMSVRIVYLQVWYFVHIHITILSVVLVVVAMICVMMSNSYMGKSLSNAAYYHRVGGWITIVILVFMTAFGGCRTPSLLSICTHWFFGICIYSFCYLLLWNSVYIPGSPSADFDVSVPNQKESEFNMALGYLIGWIVVDLTIHIIMTLVLHATDSSMNLTAARFSVPPPIPVIHKDTKVDVSGTGFRTMCFFIHGAISFIITTVLVIMILRMQPTGRNFGPHFCTHRDLMDTVMKIQQNCWYPTMSKHMGRHVGAASPFNPKFADYYEKGGI